MKTLAPWAVLGMTLGLVGCGSELSIHTSDDNGGFDPERAGDAFEQAEAQLRADPRYDAEFDAASREFGVPAAILKAVSWAQTRYENVQGEEEFEGRAAGFGVMGLVGAELEQGAALAGVTPDQAKSDVAANVRAAAALLADWGREMGVDPGQTVSWAPVVAKLTGSDDVEAQREFVRNHVFGALRLGIGAFSEELRSAGQSLELAEEYETMGQELTVAPDYAGAIWRASPNFGSRGNYKPRMVIIHTCEGKYSGCWSWQANKASGVSAHYTVSETGSEITQTVREASRGFHIAATYKSNLNAGAEGGLAGVQSNYFTLGIEHAGFGSQSSWSSGLLEASAKLTCNMTQDNGIPRDRQHIVGHGQLQPNNRTDPGRAWPWANYMERVNAACGKPAAAAPAPAAPAPSAPAPAPAGPAPAQVPGELVIDSNNTANDRNVAYVKISANWTGTAGTPGYVGSGYYYAATRPLSDGAEFWFYLPAAATKTLDAWWTPGTNRSTAAPFLAYDANGQLLGKSMQNQTVNGKTWVTLGTYNFTAGWNKVVLSRWTTTGSVVIADAVRVR